MAKAKKAEAEAEAPEAEGEGEGAAAPKKSFLSKKLIIMAAAGVLVLGGGGGGAWFFCFRKKPHEEKPAPVAVKPPAFLDMPEVLVNLSSTSNGRAQYLKAKIVLEVADQKTRRGDQAGAAARPGLVPDLSCARCARAILKARPGSIACAMN